MPRAKVSLIPALAEIEALPTDGVAHTHARILVARRVAAPKADHRVPARASAVSLLTKSPGSAVVSDTPQSPGKHVCSRARFLAQFGAHLCMFGTALSQKLAGAHTAVEPFSSRTQWHRFVARDVSQTL